jgi:hypothetical protein
LHHSTGPAFTHEERKCVANGKAGANAAKPIKIKTKKRKFQMRTMNLLKLLVTVLLGTTLMSAQATRTWVSGVGDDANPCSRTAPCKTFAGAISKTAVGGEIDALDPGGFGALTITKAITIDGGGGQVASVLVNGTNGIVVAAQAADTVILRNLRINGIKNGANGGINGIRWISGAVLIVENCDIFGFTNNGIDIAKSDGGQAFILNTTSANNTQRGISNTSSVNNVNVTIDHSRFVSNGGAGVEGADFSRFTVRDSNSSGNNFGYVLQPNAGTAEMNLSNSTAGNNNLTGLFVGGTAGISTARITGVSLLNNPAGMTIQTNGTVQSFGNNYIVTGTGNTANGTPIPPQ